MWTLWRELRGAADASARASPVRKSSMSAVAMTQCALVGSPIQATSSKNKSLAVMFVCNRPSEVPEKVPEIDNFQSSSFKSITYVGNWRPHTDSNRGPTDYKSTSKTYDII